VLQEPDDQVRNIAKVTTAVANGDLSQKISVVRGGETLALKDTHQHQWWTSCAASPRK